MKFAALRNINYCATVAILKNFVPIPKADKIQSALIFGNSVIVSKEAKAGEIGIFFPVECQLSHEFVSENNLYRKSEDGNVDPTKTGYFESSRRVKCTKFLGVKSEGLWIPLSALSYLKINLSNFNEGDIFDKIGDHKICQKYVVKNNNSGGQNNVRGKVAKLADSIVDGQFRFHFDTENLRKNIHKIQPTDIISISDKFHGTSAIFSKPLVLRNLNWFERILRKFGIKIQETEYAMVYSSRKMIKAVNGIDKSNGVHYYGSDIWGVVAKEIDDKIPNSYTIYGEIVGYTPEGSVIQKGYGFGLDPKSHELFVYRVTSTNNKGRIIELSWPQMKEFCSAHAIQHVKELFYGKACDLVTFVEGMDICDWYNDLLKYLENRWVHDQDCEYNPKMPAEGIIIRKDNLESCESWKLKNFRFLELETKELDKGTVDLETAESDSQEN
jgi:hypothetical protein